MAINFEKIDKSRPRGEAAKMPVETIRDLADQVAAKEKKSKSGEKRTAISIRIDPKVLTYFQAAGMGWQTRINNVLEDYVDRQIHG
jgi:uncharacterized protein (DUF4415 family)